MRAVQIVKDGQGQRAELAEIPDDQIGDGEVSIAIDYSAVNFKDGLGVTGVVPVVEQFPRRRGHRPGRNRDGGPRRIRSGGR